MDLPCSTSPQPPTAPLPQAHQPQPSVTPTPYRPHIAQPRIHSGPKHRVREPRQSFQYRDRAHPARHVFLVTVCQVDHYTLVCSNGAKGEKEDVGVGEEPVRVFLSGPAVG